MPMMPYVPLCLLLWEGKSEGMAPASEPFQADRREGMYEGEIIGRKGEEKL